MVQKELRTESWRRKVLIALVDMNETLWAIENAIGTERTKKGKK